MRTLHARLDVIVERAHAASSVGSRDAGQRVSERVSDLRPGRVLATDVDVGLPGAAFDLVHLRRPRAAMPDALRTVVASGIEATLAIYRSRGQDLALGGVLADRLEAAGLNILRVDRRSRA